MSKSFLFGVVVLCCAYSAAATNAAGLAFLEEKKNEPGVVVLDSGLMYKELRRGDGAQHPTADSSCECHYEGTLIDGTVFDSSYQRGSPTSFAPNQVIKGWTEAMQMMVEGDKWEMYIPSELAYGERGSPPKIQGGDALVFKMEIIKIKGGKVDANRCEPATLEGCDERETKYIEKMKTKAEKVESELKRLTKMAGDKSRKMKASLKGWISRRLAILKKLSAAAKTEKAEL